MTQPQRVESLSHAQRERLAYIDFRLYFFPDGHPKLPHLWPVKLLQAGQGGL